MFTPGQRVKLVLPPDTYDGTLIEPLPDGHWLVLLDVGTRVVAHRSDLVIPYRLAEGAGT